MDTLDICDSWIQTSVNKMGEDGAISPDKRGMNKAPRSVEPPSNDPVKISIRGHIATLPRMDSHYTRERSN